MRLVRLLSCTVLLAIVHGQVQAAVVDAVKVDAAGNTLFTGMVTAPNVLGSPGVDVSAAQTLSDSAFGTWHWIFGASDFTITLPTAVGNAGKTIGLRVRDVATAPRVYTVKPEGAQTIDGAGTVALSANGSLILMSDGAGWCRIGGVQATVTMPGTIIAYAGPTPPAGWLECNGQTVSRTVYAGLFAAIGTTWGAGDGTTTFQLPNLSRRTLVGRGGTGTATLANTVGSVGGEETHKLTVAEMPSHSHQPVVGLQNWAGGGTASGSGSAPQASAYGTTAAGGDQPHNVMQPSAVVVNLIKY